MEESLESVLAALVNRIGLKEDPSRVSTLRPYLESGTLQGVLLAPAFLSQRTDLAATNKQLYGSGFFRPRRPASLRPPRQLYRPQLYKPKRTRR